MKTSAPSSTHKKVVVLLLDRSSQRGYLNPARLADAETLGLLTPQGEHRDIPLKDIRGVYFVREFTDEFEPERKAFLSRPKLDGLWVRLKFRDNDTIEGVVPTTCSPCSTTEFRSRRRTCTAQRCASSSHVWRWRS